MASQQDAPGTAAQQGTTRTSPSSTITGTARTRNWVSFRNSWSPPVARFAAPAGGR